MNNLQHASDERVQRIMIDARGIRLSDSSFEDYEMDVLKRDCVREFRRRGRKL